MTRGSEKRIAAWLFTCCALIFAMVVVGGVTRLTHSGLSISEWQPIMGTLPPLSHQAWLDAFHKYQQTPEYRQVNAGMGLEAFKGIFWWEYFHRLLGRSIGAAFLIPFLYFLATGQLERRLRPKLALIFVMGGLQGGLGWFMVKSGLVDVPRVSPYRLTAHLGTAFLLYASILWLALDLAAPVDGRGSSALPGEALAARLGRRGPPAEPGEALTEPPGEPSPTPGLRRFSSVVSALIFLMVLVGGFVAGNKAGFAYNTFPAMAGQWIPAGLFTLEPWMRNCFENVTTVQFEHRLLALVLAGVVPAFWWRARSSSLRPGLRRASDALLAVLGVQIGLGIATLLLYVPVPLAAAHQAGALVLFSVSLGIRHQLGAREMALPSRIRREAAEA